VGEQQRGLTQSFLGLSDEEFHAVPALEKALAETINSHVEVHHVTTGTVVTALACVIGELIVKTGDDAEESKQWFLRTLDAYVSTGEDGARVGPRFEPSLFRRWTP